MSRPLFLFALIIVVLAGSSVPLRAGGREVDEDGGDAPMERFLWFYGQRAFPNGIPDGARYKALKQARAMSAAKKRDLANRIESTVWQQAGPVNGGGRINAIAYDATATTPTMYIGAAEGGVWKGVNPGGTWMWTPLTDKADALAMGAIALDPKNSNILYAGTGEWSEGGSWGASLFQGSGLYAGAGLIKTTDGGATWHNMGLTNCAAFGRIVVNPDNSQIVWAATNRGLYRTSDGGTTWTTMINDSACCDLQVDPVDHKRLYVAIANNGVFGMFDKDTTATRLGNGFPAIDTVIGRIALSAIKNGNSTVVCAVVAMQNGSLQGVYKYSSFWTKLKSPPASSFSQAYGSQGGYDITIAVDPTNANHIIVGGMQLWQTTNGGTTWTENTEVHYDQHMLMFDPTGSGIVMLGNDGGIWLSGDNGSSFQDVSNGLAITQFYGIDVDPASGGSVYGGAQDNGSYSGNGPQWNSVAGGDGGATKVDPANNYMYIQIVAPNQQVDKVRLDGGGAGTLYDYSTTTNKDRKVWIHPVAIDRSTGGFYFGTNYLYRSDKGLQPTVISPDLTRGSVLSCIAVCQTDPAIVWTGSMDGLVYVTNNTGASWKNVSSELPGRAVTRIVSPSQDVAYATMSGFGPGHVMKTTNRGVNWTDISANLPDVPVNGMAIDPDNHTHLFIGTDIGVLYSTDDGGSWVPYMEGLPNVVVNELVVQDSTKLLYAGTYGRSTWSAPMTANMIALGSPVYGPLWFTNQSYPIVWYGVSSATISYSTDSGATWTIIDHGQNGPTYQWDVPSGINTALAMIKVDDGTTTLISDPFTIRPPHKGDITATVSRPFVPYGLAFDGRNLWSTSFYEHKIYKLDPDFMTVRDTIPSPNGLDSCTGIAYAFDQNPPVLYVHRLMHDAQNRPKNKIYVIDTTGRLLNTFDSPCIYPTGLAYDGTQLYAVDRDSVKFFVLDPASGSTVGAEPDVVGLSNGPRGLSFIRNSNEQFLHIITVFNPNLSNTYMYRMQLDGSGFHPQDTAALLYEGAVINARSIEKDTRYPNSYWVSDFGTGTSGSIYRVVGFDVQALDVTAPTAQAVWTTGTSQTISWSSTLVDSVVIEFSSDNGVTWTKIAGPMPAGSGQYQWQIPTMQTSPQCKIRISGTGQNALHSTSASFTIQNGSGAYITLNAPAAGVVWRTGTPVTISWTSKLVDSVLLEYTVNAGSGAIWHKIAGPISALINQYSWTVPDSPSTQCMIRITSVGSTQAQSTSQIFTIKSSNLVREKTVSPDGFELYQNYPNPFNPSTEIMYVLPVESVVSLQIFETDGKLVQTLVDGKLAAGEHRATFDATALPSGSYVYRLRIGTTELSRSMILSK